MIKQLTQAALLTKFVAMRQEAEKILAGMSDEGQAETKTLYELVHELNLHQIELELQNEALRETQQALTLAQEQYFDLFNHAPVGYFILNKEGLIVATNQTGIQQLGRTRESLVGTNFTLNIVSEQRDGFYRYLKRLFKTHKPQRHHYQLLQADGTRIDVYLDSLLITPGPGLEMQCRMTVSDITTFKQAEMEKTRLLEQLSQKHILENMGTLATSMAHDFNDLLTAIRVNLSEAAQSLPPDAPAQDCLRNANQATSGASQLIQQLKLFSSNPDLSQACLNLSEEVQKILPLLEVSILKGIKLEYQPDPFIPQILANQGKIQQIILNLLTNAVDAIGKKPQGRITLKTGTVMITSQYRKRKTLNRTVPNGRYVFLEMQDNGQGIAPEILPLIFDPFVSSKGPGQGLGMCIVDSIVHDYHGAIELQSQLGLGSSIRIILPIHAD